ncbi:MAG: MlaD family protein [Terriglobia bacterium]|jgi:phospholipid/cholesterol/gamma-HCH transport system substrate-binding protein
MAKNREEIKAGAVVVVAVVLFLIALVFVGGVNLFRKPKTTYITYFKFAGGLESGSFVRFAGMKVGTVKEARMDKDDPTRVRIRMDLDSGTPVRANSRARIASLGFLGDNYVEVTPGTRDSPRLPPGSEIPSAEIVQMSDVFTNVNELTLNAKKLVTDVDDKVLVISDNANQLIANLNNVVNEVNRQHFSSAIAQIDAMLAEDRPSMKSTLANLDKASAKIGPTIDSTQTTIDKANKLVGNMDSMIQENRAEFHDALLRLRDSLVEAQRLMGDIDETVITLRPDLDETLANIRAASQNLKQFTDTVKQRPYSLIRIKPEKDRVPPTGK